MRKKEMLRRRLGGVSGPLRRPGHGPGAGGRCGRAGGRWGDQQPRPVEGAGLHGQHGAAAADQDGEVCDAISGHLSNVGNANKFANGCELPLHCNGSTDFSGCSNPSPAAKKEAPELQWFRGFSLLSQCVD